jgi:NAD(P)-dependent dehydrogenase (short-subunit alcohol dehydrogenase family)
MALSIDLGGRIVLVCGAGNAGIGAAVSDLVAQAGATVVAIDQTQALVDETVARIEAAGGGVLGIVADLMDREQTDRILPMIREAFGRIDGVVNVAGGTKKHQWREIERMSDDLVQEVVRLNFGYVYAICREAAKLMIETGSGGSMVNIASISALAGAPFHSAYGAAKSAIIAVSRSMAAEWSRHGVRVNALSPGAVETARVLNHLGYTRPDETYGRRVTRPEEIAGACLFLLSDLAGGVSGQNLVVDAGISTDFAAGSIARLQSNLFDDTDA